MGIRISHGDVKTLAQFAVKAGQGEQAVREAGEAAATERQEISQQTQLQAQAMRQQADIDMALVDAQNRRSAMEFQSFLGAETARRNMAWEQDKMEQVRQHDLDMVMTRKELESTYQIEKEQRERSRIDLQLEALDDAVKAGRISQATADNEKLRIEIGVSGRQSPIFGGRDADDAFAQFIQSLTAGDQLTAQSVGRQTPAKSGLVGEVMINAAGDRIQYNSETGKWQTL